MVKSSDITDQPRPQVAIVAPESTRNNPEGAFMRFLRDNADNLRRKFHLIAAEGSCEAITNTGYFEKGKHITSLKPGSHGGILEIAYRVVTEQCKVVIFLYDPSEVRSESPETRALTRVCIYKQIVLLTTVATADYWLKYQSDSWLKEHGFHKLDWLHAHKGGEGDFNPFLPEKSTIALIAHNDKKDEMKKFVKNNLKFLKRFERILATGTTGTLIRGWFYEFPDLVEKVVPKASGPKGGDVQIAHDIMEKRCQTVIFLHDPLTAHPHDPDINLLRRTCQLPNVSCILLSDLRSANDWVKSFKTWEKSGKPNKLTLAEKLRNRFKSLREVLVIPIDTVEKTLVRLNKIPSEAKGWGRTEEQWREHEQEWEKIMTELAKFTARYLDDVLNQLTRERNENIVITVNLGRAIGIFAREIMNLYKELKLSPITNLHILPMTGDPDAISRGFTTHSNAVAIARAYGCKEDLDPIAGGIFTYGKENLVPKNQPALWNKLLRTHIVLTSIGAIPTEKKYWKESRLSQDRQFKKVIREAIKNQAIGDIGPILFDKEGKQVPSSVTPVGLQYDDLVRIAQEGRVILMVGGDISRYDSIKAVLKRGLCSVLITDPQTARNLLSKDT